MPDFVGTPDYQHGTQGVTGVLVTNLGTPDAPTTKAVRRYLAEFLSDPRVVEYPRLLWMLILHGIILNIRPSRTTKAYDRIWFAEGAPLLAIARKQLAALQRRLVKTIDGPIRVELAMRYGNPSISSALENLRQANANRLLILPLYPQYSASTTASTFDAVADVLKTWRWLPQLRMVMDYHRHDGWLQAIANSIREHWEKNGRAKRLLMSFHGLPKRFLLNGDPYYCQCYASAYRIAEILGLDESEWQLVFQSRFGREEWLKPYCDKTLEALGSNGLESVDMICPGFSADCLETLQEVAVENRDIFLKAGGKRYSYIPALNDRHDHIDALTSLISDNLAGWPLAATPSEQRQAGRQRALAYGAKTDPSMAETGTSQ